MIDKYNLLENEWMKRTLRKREQCAHVYMKLVFTRGMRSTQLSESLNRTLRGYLKGDHNIVQFLTHFNRIVVVNGIRKFLQYMILDKSCLECGIKIEFLT